MRNRLKFRPDSSGYSPLRGSRDVDELRLNDSPQVSPEISISQMAESIPVEDELSSGGVLPDGVLSADLALDLVLNQIAEQTRLATASSGVAIALTRSGNLVCRATTGSAPDLGMRLDPYAGLSGLALQTRMPQHCADAENDSRVDAGACRNLRVRSILVVPILKEKEIAGIIEAFAADPYHFREHDIETLRSFCRQIVERIDHAAAQTAAAIVQENPVAVAPPARQTKSSGWDGWTLFLSLCVIVAACFLGWLIGRSEKRKIASAQAQRVTPVAAAVDVPTKSQAPAAGEVPATGDGPAAGQALAQKPGPTAKPVEKRAAPDNHSAGGLVVSQNGKIVFRETPRIPASAARQKAAASKTQFVTSEAVNEYLRYRVEPLYPESARQHKIQGPVVLKVMVAADGGVQQVQVVSGDNSLAEAASKAVVQWKFKPLSRMGQPVEFETQVTVDFKLP